MTFCCSLKLSIFSRLKDNPFSGEGRGQNMTRDEKELQNCLKLRSWEIPLCQAVCPSKKCLLEGWPSKRLACLQNTLCEQSASRGEERETVWGELCPFSWPSSKVSAPYMAGNSVRAEAVTDDLVLAECSLTHLRVPEWSRGQRLSGCWLLALPQPWEQQLVPMESKSMALTVGLTACPHVLGFLVSRAGDWDEALKESMCLLFSNSPFCVHFYTEWAESPHSKSEHPKLLTTLK